MRIRNSLTVIDLEPTDEEIAWLLPSPDLPASHMPATPASLPSRETPLHLRRLLRIKIRAIVLLPHSVVIIDEYFHGIRT